jgi:hypothetical protein
MPSVCRGRGLGRRSRRVRTSEGVALKEWVWEMSSAKVGSLRNELVKRYVRYHMQGQVDTVTVMRHARFVSIAGGNRICR